jgi:hypothetical protein
MPVNNLIEYIYGFVYHVVIYAAIVLQKNKHNTKHLKATAHPIIKTFEPS